MDVNKEATSTWIETTDGFERVRSVLRQTREPTPVTQIAEQAHVSETSARKHLDRLAELGPATTTQDGRTTLYHRNEDHHIFQRIRHLQRNHTQAELLDGIREMKNRLQKYREQHNAESPEELAIDINDTDTEPWHVISEWESTRQNLALAQTALSYGQTRKLIEA